MKKLFILLMSVSLFRISAQISLENTYPNGNLNTGYLYLVHLNASGYKYAVKNYTNITLYNLNHSVFTTINTPTVPALSCPSCPLNIYFISEDLFDTNPATIEYMWMYTTAGNSITHIRVFDQPGNTVFAEDSVTLAGPGPGYTGQENFITTTSNGVKMIIYKSNSNAARVYSLPGVLPCHMCTNGVMTGMASNGHHDPVRLSNYPNPSSEQTVIEYELPKGNTNGEIVIYDVSGVEVKRYKVTNAFSNITVTVSDISAGTYFYQLQTLDGQKTARKMIVVK